jgi:hypothetical protein
MRKTEMSAWTTKELANKARHPEVWKRLLDAGICEEHRPSRSVIDEAIQLLESEGNLEAAERVRVFRGYRREDMQDILCYDC